MNIYRWTNNRNKSPELVECMLEAFSSVGAWAIWLSDNVLAIYLSQTLGSRLWKLWAKTGGGTETTFRLVFGWNLSERHCRRSNSDDDHLVFSWLGDHMAAQVVQCNGGCGWIRRVLGHIAHLWFQHFASGWTTWLATMLNWCQSVGVVVAGNSWHHRCDWIQWRQWACCQAQSWCSCECGSTVWHGLDVCHLEG